MRKPEQPKTPREWQESVDAAAAMLAFADCRAIVGGPAVNTERYDRLIAEAAVRGVRPSKSQSALAEEIILQWNAHPTVLAFELALLRNAHPEFFYERGFVQLWMEACVKPTDERRQVQGRLRSEISLKEQRLLQRIQDEQGWLVIRSYWELSVGAVEKSALICSDSPDSPALPPCCIVGIATFEDWRRQTIRFCEGLPVPPVFDILSSDAYFYRLVAE